MKNPDHIIFELSNVKYKHILDIETLKFDEEKVSGIVAKSGSGKTTLLRLLNKLISPDSGNIFYKNKHLRDIPSVNLRSDVVMMPQNFVIFDGDVKENLLIGLRFSDKELVNNSVLERLLQIVELPKSLSDSPLYFSGGEKQRLSLARALLLKPSVLLLDEPSSALDKETEMEVMGNIVKVCKEYGIKIIFVTHSPSLANTYADEIIHLENGKVHFIQNISHADIHH